ncbi:MAG: tRNA (adenine-N1)-methyltransferase [Candidatus Binatia bacterium]
MERPESGQLRAGDSVLFIDSKEREYLRVLRAGARVHIRGGTMQADHLIGLEEGCIVYTTAREPFLMLRPSFAQLIPNLPRRAQVIYPKDIGPILLWGDIYPGATVIEIGAGPGALSMALLRAVGLEGRVISYETRPDFAEMARNNVQQFYGTAPNWTVKVADAFAGIEERGVDRMTVDLAEPWRLLPAAAEALRSGGLIVGYVPTVMQVKQFVDGLRDHGGFAAIQSFETMVRFWHVKNLSVRPEHRMIGHTGFIVVARRVCESSMQKRVDSQASL